MIQTSPDVGTSEVIIKRTLKSEHIMALLDFDFNFGILLPPVTSEDDIVKAIIHIKSTSVSQTGIDATIYRILRTFDNSANWEYRRGNDRWTNRIGGAILGDRRGSSKRSTEDYDTTISDINTITGSDTWYEFDVTNQIKDMMKMKMKMKPIPQHRLFLL
ncbi:unnamed protein product [marine sediment metagenome]|uniref:Uncharacterized protein n=1 Tax=marine sediment metagenome TaxID=412755 RepID=X1B3V4_9ZZZZ